MISAVWKRFLRLTSIAMMLSTVIKTSTIRYHLNRTDGEKVCYTLVQASSPRWHLRILLHKLHVDVVRFGVSMTYRADDRWPIVQRRVHNKGGR